MARQIVLDTETTGLDAASGDRIVEIGCVELIDRKLTGHNLHLYINPERDSHPDAERVHGLSTAFLSGKPKFAEIARQFLDYVQGAEIIIHNAPFDVGFLNKELERLGLPPLSEHTGDITDTLALAKQIYPGKRNSLDALCDRLDVDRSSRTLHGALLDAELLASVYINLTRGQETLLMQADDAHESAAAQTLELDGEDLSAIELPVIAATESERAAHANMLAGIDKASGGQTLWRQGGYIASPAAAA